MRRPLLLAAAALLAGCGPSGPPDYSHDELLAHLKAKGLSFTETYRGPHKSFPKRVDIRPEGAGPFGDEVRITLCRDAETAAATAETARRTDRSAAGAFAWGRFCFEASPAQAAKVRRALGLP